MNNNLNIVEYEPWHQPFFETLNKAWLERFGLEELDKYVLMNPDDAIIKKGGAILIAMYDDVVAGVVGLRKTGAREFEFTKMTVDEKYRRKGIAESLSKAAFEKARQLGADRVILYSHSVLTPALNLYKKLGFKQIPLEQGTYARADIKMELRLEPMLSSGQP